MTIRSSLLVGAWLASFAVAPVALADDPQAAGVAQGLFEGAREEMKRGDFASACPKLAESQRLDPSAGTLLNLALCEESLGEVASAWVRVRELVDTLPEGDGRRALAERKVASLSKRLPKLVVRVAATMPEGVRVVVDDAELGASSFGVPLPVDPGPHHLVVRARGREDRSAEVTLAEGQEVEWTATVGEVPASAPAPASPSTPALAPTPAPARAPHSHAPAWVALGAGLAGLVAAGVLGALTLDRRSTVLSDCPGKQCTSGSDLTAASEGQAFFVGTLAALGAGAGGVGLGAYFLVREGHEPLPGVEAAGLHARGASFSYGFAF